MAFFKRNARSLIPLPWAVLSARKLWEAVHGGDFATYCMAIGFGGLAHLFCARQQYIHADRRGV